MLRPFFGDTARAEHALVDHRRDMSGPDALEDLREHLVDQLAEIRRFAQIADDVRQLVPQNDQIALERFSDQRWMRS